MLLVGFMRGVPQGCRVEEVLNQMQRTITAEARREFSDALFQAIHDRFQKPRKPLVELLGEQKIHDEGPLMTAA